MRPKGTIIKSVSIFVSSWDTWGWLCFRGSWAQWRSYSSLSQLVEMGGQSFPQWCSCKDSQRRKRLMLLRKEEMEWKLGQVTLGCFLFSLVVSVLLDSLLKIEGEFMADWRVAAQILGDHWSQGQEKWWKPALPFPVFTSCVAVCKKVLKPEMTCWCQIVFLHWLLVTIAKPKSLLSFCRAELVAAAGSSPRQELEEVWSGLWTDSQETSSAISAFHSFM